MAMHSQSKSKKSDVEASVTTNRKDETETIKVAVPKGKKLPKVTVTTAPNLVGKQVSGSVSGFVGFLRENAIVGLAIGFVLGTQVQAVVKQLITSFIDPLFQLVFAGNKALSERTFTLHLDDRYANFAWGAMAYSLIDFLFIAVVIYIIIKLSKLEQLDKKKE